MTNPSSSSETSHSGGDSRTPAAGPVGAGGNAAKSEAKAENRYRSTLNLPQTTFAMKANLVQNEPATLKRWEQIDLYTQVRKARSGAPRFVLHDGPPYANGSIHLGHMMNKVLKDIVVRTKTMQGFDSPFVPGWDCHGLPIEHKVMQEMVENKKVEKLNTLDEWTRKKVVRSECQKHAEKYHKLHTQQMTRLLTLADYKHPYLTMKPDFEGATLEVLADLMDRGLVYRALKPVHWSVANETALAEAELEYFDREDTSVYVDFEAAEMDAVYAAFGLPEHAADDEGDELSDGETEGDGESEEEGGPQPGVRPHSRPTFMIWTTTPWTLPANVAIAVNPEIQYSLVYVDGNISIMASKAIERVTAKAKSETVRVIATTEGKNLIGLRYVHPFMKAQHGAATLKGVDLSRIFKVVGADYVTLEDGTGLVHTAPGHGTEDYQTGLREGLPVYCPVRGDGTYDESVPEFLRPQEKKTTIWEANELVVTHLRNSGHLFFDHKFMHSYPHDWRSKTPVIFRCTEQWFVGVDQPFAIETEKPTSLRERALSATQDAAGSGDKGVAFVPDWGRNRMRGMLESRPDWCISRQRAWGLPIPSFLCTDGNGKEFSFMTPASVRVVAALVRSKGSDAWFVSSPAELLAGYDPTKDPHFASAMPMAWTEFLSKARKGVDILDVWFESGSSWNAVVKERSLGYPADLYLEGSDQHRGWFQLSLLPALGSTGRPPFRTLLTHGFMVGKDGAKLSKSKGDSIEELFSDYGADVLRWWVLSLPFENDIKVDRDFFDEAGESYRKVRNTIRFMLSNLSDFTPRTDGNRGDSLDLTTIAPTSIDAWVLSEFSRLSAEVVHAFNTYAFRQAHQAIYNFCNDTLSAVYLACVKDRLYCDAKGSERRRRTQTTLWELTDGLCRLLAPVLCHTSDEAFRSLWRVEASDLKCIHLSTFLMSNGVPGVGVKADARWAGVMNLRSQLLSLIDKAKTQTGLENPLDAGAIVADREGAFAGFDPVDLADLLGISEVTIDSNATEHRIVDLRSRERCERSWKRDSTVRKRSDGGVLSDRDAAAVGVA